METYYELTIKHSDGTQETIRGARGFSVERVVEYTDEYNYYKIMYYKGNTRYEVTHPGDYEYNTFKANIWWVEFLAGNTWEKASRYSDRLSFAIDDLNELEATTDGFVYRINGGILGGKEEL